MTTHILNNLPELHKQLSTLPDQEFVVMKSSLYDIPVVVTLENRIVKSVSVSNEHSVPDEHGTMIPASEYAARFLNLSKVYTDIYPYESLSLYGVLRVHASHNNYVQSKVLFTDFTVPGLHVADYSARLALISTWGFQVPRYQRCLLTELIQVIATVVEKDTDQLDHVCVVNNIQNHATHVYCVPIA